MHVAYRLSVCPIIPSLYQKRWARQFFVHLRRKLLSFLTCLSFYCRDQPKNTDSEKNNIKYLRIWPGFKGWWNLSFKICLKHKFNCRWIYVNKIFENVCLQFICFWVLFSVSKDPWTWFSVFVRLILGFMWYWYHQQNRFLTSTKSSFFTINKITKALHVYGWNIEGIH